MRLTEAQQAEIKRNRNNGIGYLKIAREMNLSVNTVRSFCKRNDLTGYRRIVDGVQGCLCCGEPVKQNPGRKEKKFCSDNCRAKWWAKHQHLMNRKAVYSFTCASCGKAFTAYGNDHRKYCSHDCYIADRFGDYSPRT